MLKRNNCVYTQIVKHCLADELLLIIRNLSNMNETEFYSAKLYDDWGAYDGLVDFLLRLRLQLQAKGAKAHYRVKHSKNEFAKGKNHINGIENVFVSIMLANVSKSGYAKHRLSKFKGIKKENFLLHLKETEFRYNTQIKQQDFV